MLDDLRLWIFIGRNYLGDRHLFLSFSLVFSINLSFSSWWLGHGLTTSWSEIILVWASAWVKRRHVWHLRLVYWIKKRWLFHLWQIGFFWNNFCLFRLLHLSDSFALINAFSLCHVLLLCSCELRSVCIGPREICFFFSLLNFTKLSLYPCFSTKHLIVICFKSALRIRLSWRMAQPIQLLLARNNLFVIRQYRWFLFFVERIGYSWIQPWPEEDLRLLITTWVKRDFWRFHFLGSCRARFFDLW